jgi:transcriptional regulator with XRE-family HTH domain
MPKETTAARKRGPTPKHVLTVLRKKLGLRQTEFAERVGLSRRTLQNVEYGQPLSRKSAAIIAERFNVSIDWLLANDANRPMMTALGEAWTHQERRKVAEFFKDVVAPESNAIVRAMFAASVCPDLLQDYLMFRSFFERVGIIDPDAILRWREIQSKAWGEFLKANPELSEQSKKATRPTLTRADIESIKDDAETVGQMLDVLESGTAKKPASKR